MLDEDGVAELAKEVIDVWKLDLMVYFQFDVIHVPEIKRGESNLPLVNELFAAAAELGKLKRGENFNFF